MFPLSYTYYVIIMFGLFPIFASELFTPLREDATVERILNLLNNILFQ